MDNSPRNESVRTLLRTRRVSVAPLVPWGIGTNVNGHSTVNSRKQSVVQLRVDERAGLRS